VSFGVLIVIILKLTFVAMKMAIFLMMVILSQCLKVSVLGMQARMKLVLLLMIESIFWGHSKNCEK